MLAFRKTLEHSAYFLYFPPCVCPFGNFLFFIFYTVLSLHNSHHEEHLFPHRDGSCQQLLRYFSVHCSGTNVVRFGEGDVMQLCICSGVLPVPKQTYRLPFCLSIRLLQTESGTLCVCLSAASSVLVNLSCLLRERQQRMGAFFPLSHVFKEFPLFGFYRLNSKQFPFPPTNCICKFVFISCCLLCV